MPPIEYEPTDWGDDGGIMPIEPHLLNRIEDVLVELVEAVNALADSE